MARKPRVQVDDPLFNAAPTLAPKARAVDAFVNPGTIAPLVDNSLDDLGRALSGISDSITNAGVTAGKRMDDADFARAAADTRAAGGALSEAVRSGRLRAGESPAYLRGLATAQLSALGTLFDSEFKEAFARSKARGSDDPNAVQDFAAEFQKSFADKHLGGFDPEDVLLTFEPKEIGAIKQVIANHREIRLARKEAEGVEAIGIQASQFLAAYEGVPIEKRNVPVLTENMRDMVDPQRVGSLTWLGLSQSAANDAIVAAGIEAAVETGDLTVIDAIRNIPTHSGGRFGSISKYKKLFKAAEDSISGENMRDLRDREYLKGLKKAAAGEKVVAKINAAIDGGNHKLARSLLGELNKAYPRLVAGMRGSIVSALNEKFVRRMTGEMAIEMESLLALPGATVASAITPFAEFMDPQRVAFAFQTLRINREFQGFITGPDYKDALKGLIAKLSATAMDATASKLVAALDAPDVKAAFHRRVVAALKDKKPGERLTPQELADISRAVADNPAFGIGMAKTANEDFIKKSLGVAASFLHTFSDVPDMQRQVEAQIVRLTKMTQDAARVGANTKFMAAERLNELIVQAGEASDALVARLAAAGETKPIEVETEFHKLVRERAERGAANQDQPDDAFTIGQ